jgi:hypothetical protein
MLGGEGNAPEAFLGGHRLAKPGGTSLGFAPVDKHKRCTAFPAGFQGRSSHGGDHPHPPPRGHKRAAGGPNVGGQREASVKISGRIFLVP